jgi:hypothetical protein
MVRLSLASLAPFRTLEEKVMLKLTMVLSGIAVALTGLQEKGPTCARDWYAWFCLASQSRPRLSMIRTNLSGISMIVKVRSLTVAFLVRLWMLPW